MRNHYVIEHSKALDNKGDEKVIQPNPSRVRDCDVFIQNNLKEIIDGLSGDKKNRLRI